MKHGLRVALFVITPIIDKEGDTIFLIEPNGIWSICYLYQNEQ